MGDEIKFLYHWLPTIICGGALTLIWTDMRNTRNKLIGMVENVELALRKALYADDGRTNFMPRLSCEREQSRCQSLTCGKIEALSVKMDLMDSRREHAKEQQQAQMGDVKQALAVLSERMEQLSQEFSEIQRVRS
jgi:uncharacterized protein YceH (UPF0502 family)